MSKTIARSFATHPKSKYWSKNNTVSPEEVSPCGINLDEFI